MTRVMVYSKQLVLGVALLSPSLGIGQPMLLSVTQPIPQRRLLADFDY
jgi:hypothetical protein